ncbi:MAG: response regulator transcription factor [Clostridiales bacterium]|nr:response regulator transcription factor [Clostridiales bacterium]
MASSILVVDDHPLVRRGIIDILSVNKEHEIYEASNIAAAMTALKRQQIDIIIIDINLGKENGFELVLAVKDSYPEIKRVILTSSVNVFDYKKAMELNVDAYIIKDAFIEDIVYALQVVSRGGKYYSPQIVQQSMNGFMPKELLGLTDREKEILVHLSRGMTNAQISNALFISEGTTKKHISNILSKLNLNNRVEAVLYTRKIFGSEI